MVNWPSEIAFMILSPAFHLQCLRLTFSVVLQMPARALQMQSFFPQDRIVSPSEKLIPTKAVLQCLRFEIQPLPIV